METKQREAGAVQGFTLLSCITLAVMGALLIAPIAPKMAEAFKDTPNIGYLIGMVITVPSLCVAIFSPFAGMLGDKIGRRKLLIPAMVLYSLFGMMPMFLNDIMHIIASRVGVGIMEALVMTLSTTMIGDLFKGEARDKWLAGQTATASTSAVIFLIIGGFAGRYGWQGPFIVYAFPLLLAVLVAIFTWEPKESKEHHAEAPHFFDIKGEAHNNFPSQKAKATFPWVFMAIVCTISLFASLMFYAVQIQLSTALDALGVKDTGMIGILTAIASLAVPVGTFVFWKISKKLSISWLLTVEFLIMGFAYIFMSQQTDFKMLVLCATISQIGAGMTLPTLLTWAMSRLEFEVRGRGTGIWQSTFALGQFVCGMFIPFVAERTNGILGAFLVLGIMSAIAAIPSIFIAIRAKNNIGTITE